MGGKPAARLTDIGSQHGGYPPTPIITGSDVTCNGRPIARQGDMLVPHTKPKNPTHPRTVAGGSGSVLVNGKPWARQGDPISCGGKISGGSGDTIVGDGPKNRNPIEPAEWQALVGKLAAPEHRPGNGYERSALAAQVAVKYRGPEGAAATWHEHYARQMNRGESTPPPATVKDPAEREGLKRAEAEQRQAKLQTPAMPRVMTDGGSPADSGPEPWPEYEKPASFDEALERLDESEKRIREHGYQPRYSDEDLRQMAEEPIDDSIVVRVMEVGYLKKNEGDDLLTGKLGGDLEGTDGIKYWTTTFKHVEDADHDTKKIMEKLGIPYDPNKKYVMAMIDREKASEVMGSESFVPTSEKLGAFASETYPDELPPERVEAAMDDEFKEEYKELMAAAKETDDDGQEKFDVWNEPGLNEFADAKGLSGEQKQKFQDRLLIHQNLGANAEFRGDGVTEELDDNVDKELGAVETFTYDRDPKTLQELSDRGVVSIHPLP